MYTRHRLRTASGSGRQPFNLEEEESKPPGPGPLKYCRNPWNSAWSTGFVAATVITNGESPISYIVSAGMSACFSEISLYKRIVLIARAPTCYVFGVYFPIFKETNLSRRIWNGQAGVLCEPWTSKDASWAQPAPIFAPRPTRPRIPSALVTTWIHQM